MTAAPVLSPRLVARTREVEPGGDLLDGLGPGGFAWLRDGAGFVAAGEAARVPADQAEAVLAAIEVDDPVARPGTGAIAVGALPFDPTARGTLVVPASVLGHSRDGRSWLTEIGPVSPVPPVLGSVPARFVVDANGTRSEWRRAVGRVLRAIEHGELVKAVLARSVTVTADVPFMPRAVLTHLRATQAGSFVYGAGGFVGASPELLLRRHGTRVESRPMAGTAADEAAMARLARSSKDGLEHRLVVEAVVDALARWCDRLEVEPSPSVLRFGTIAHLATGVTGWLPAGAPGALTLARVLHPTPAVAGTPRDAALGLIGELEQVGRGRYAGPVGWVDGRGDGEWAVALRSAELKGCHARLFAGAGIVVGSDPDAEWAETEAKLDPMLRALVRP